MDQSVPKILTTYSYINRIIFQEDLIYTCSGNDIYILNGENIDSLYTINNIEVRNAQEFVIHGNYLFVGLYNRGIEIYNISDPENIHEVGYYRIRLYPEGLAVSGNYVYMLAGREMYVYDVSDALNVETAFPTIVDDYSYMNISPNPFNSSTRISYKLPTTSDVSITICSSSGKSVFETIFYHQSAGHKIFEFNAKDLSSGLYILQLNLGGNLVHEKMVVLR